MHVFNCSAILFSLQLSSHLVIMVLVSAIAQWILGFLWYGVVFKKSWRTLVGFAADAKPKGAAFGMITAFIACLLLSFVLGELLAVKWIGTNTFTGGVKIGVICWLGFMAPPLFAQHINENRRANLFAINAGYWLLAMALGGGLLAAFHS
jgi:hypothetical protein